MTREEARRLYENEKKDNLDFIYPSDRLKGARDGYEGTGKPITRKQLKKIIFIQENCRTRYPFNLEGKTTLDAWIYIYEHYDEAYYYAKQSKISNLTITVRDAELEGITANTLICIPKFQLNVLDDMIEHSKKLLHETLHNLAVELDGRAELFDEGHEPREIGNVTVDYRVIEEEISDMLSAMQAVITSDTEKLKYIKTQTTSSELLMFIEDLLK